MLEALSADLVFYKPDETHAEAAPWVALCKLRSIGSIVRGMDKLNCTTHGSRQSHVVQFSLSIPCAMTDTYCCSFAVEIRHPVLKLVHVLLTPTKF